jgi:adenylylsulfate kinase-like enzyme
VIVVVTGPIASGKTVLVRALAGELRAAGLVAATLDRDDVYELLEERGTTAGDEATWQRANRLAAAFAAALDAEADVVLVESDAPIERALHVALVASIEAALERVQQDPTRGVSRDPAVLRAHYAAYTPTSADLTIDTGELSLAETVQSVLAFVLHRRT